MRHTRRTRALALAVVVTVAWSLALRWWLLSVVDLRDFPGAAGGQSLAAAAAGAFHGSWSAWLIGLVLPLADGDIGAAAHLVAWLSSAAMMVGAALGAGALAGWRGALSGAVVSGAWSQSLFVGLLVGADPPAVGAAWLGVGLAWASQRGGGLSLLAAPGAALVVWSVSIKELSLPALGLLALTPILGRGWSRLVSTTALIGGGVWAWRVLSPGELQHSATLPALSIESIVVGLRAIHAAAPGWPDGLLDQVILATVLAGLVPGPRWRQRGVGAVLSVVILALTAAALGGRLCPRLLLSASFGGVVMMAVLAARLGTRRISAVWAIALVGLGLSLDTWAWLGAWSQERTWFADARELPLPPAPEPWARRYQTEAYRLNNGRLRDITTAGGVTLAKTAAAGIGLPPLRDRRDEVPLAISVLLEQPGTLLHPRLCCTASLESCAARLVDDLDAAGMMLIVPRHSAAEPMVDRSFEEWSQRLIDAAQARGGLRQEGNWWIRAPTRSGGEPPCPQAAPKTGTGSAWPPKTP